MKEETPRVGQNLDLKEGEPRGQSVDVKEETTRSEPISEGGDLEELFGDNLDNENGTSWKQRDQNMKIKKTYTWQHPLHEWKPYEEGGKMLDQKEERGSMRARRK